MAANHCHTFVYKLEVGISTPNGEEAKKTHYLTDRDVEHTKIKILFHLDYWNKWYGTNHFKLLHYFLVLSFVRFSSVHLVKPLTLFLQPNKKSSNKITTNRQYLQQADPDPL